MTYAAAVVGKRGEAVPQLASRAVGAKHVFEVGESMCLRHGRRCSLSECPPIDLLVADCVVDSKILTAAVSFVQPRVVAILAPGARGPDDGLKTALGRRLGRVLGDYGRREPGLAIARRDCLSLLKTSWRRRPCSVLAHLPNSYRGAHGEPS